MRTPVVVVAGIDEAPMAAATMALQWDLPGVAVVRHDIDHEREVLVRVVADATGVIEQDEIELEHLCYGCANLFEILPTLDRLARTGRWQALIARLPLGAPADSLAEAIATDPRWARRLRVGSVVVPVADDIEADLLGDELLSERNAALHDERGVGEVLAALVEYADVVAGSGRLTETGTALLRTLARPDALIVDEPTLLGADAELLGRYKHSAASAWSDPLAVPEADSLPGTWQLVLSSPDPMHAERLLERLEELGSGPFRTRGCFWLATRPGDALLWDGAGGQLSIGTHEPWGARTPQTRLLFTGLGVPPEGLREIFADLLDSTWRTTAAPVAEDGFEPWLGQIRSIA